MNTLSETVKDHYFKPGIYEEIIERLRSMGADPDNLTRRQLSAVDEFHVRGAVVSKELADSIDISRCKVLDVGCGLGGPCRMLAEVYHCEVTGIDLNDEYVRTAAKLSQRVGLQEKTTFLVANAIELPFDDQSFDVVWTQHVQMNVSEKKKFYDEINRVLKPGGFFLYYDIFKDLDGEITYPMPWASRADMSFLFRPEEMNAFMESNGLSRLRSVNETEAGISFFEQLFAKIASDGPPKLGLNVLMGASTVPKLKNLAAHLKRGVLQLQSGVYQKG